MRIVKQRLKISYSDSRKWRNCRGIQVFVRSFSKCFIHSVFMRRREGDTMLWHESHIHHCIFDQWINSSLNVSVFCSAWIIELRHLANGEWVNSRLADYQSCALQLDCFRQLRFSVKTIQSLADRFFTLLMVQGFLRGAGTGAAGLIASCLCTYSPKESELRVLGYSTSQQITR